MANFFEKGIGDMSLEEMDRELTAIQTERATRQEVKRQETRKKKETVSFTTLFPEVKDAETRRQLLEVMEATKLMNELKKKGKFNQEEFLAMQEQEDQAKEELEIEEEKEL